MEIRKTYVYVSDFAVVTFVVAGKDDWSEEHFDSAAEFDLKEYVRNPEAFWLESVFDEEKTDA